MTETNIEDARNPPALQQAKAPRPAQDRGRDRRLESPNIGKKKGASQPDRNTAPNRHLTKSLSRKGL